MGSANTDLQAQMRKAETKDITENDALTQRHKILTWKPEMGKTTGAHILWNNFTLSEYTKDSSLTYRDYYNTLILHQMNT